MISNACSGSGLLRGYMYRTKHRNGICRITLFQRFIGIEVSWTTKSTQGKWLRRQWSSFITLIRGKGHFVVCLHKCLCVLKLRSSPVVWAWRCCRPRQYFPQAVLHHQHLSIGLARAIYTRCIYGIFGREITKYTVIYGVYTRFWPTLPINPTHSSTIHNLRQLRGCFLHMQTLDKLEAHLFGLRGALSHRKIFSLFAKLTAIARLSFTHADFGQAGGSPVWAERGSQPPQDLLTFCQRRCCVV